MVLKSVDGRARTNTLNGAAKSSNTGQAEKCDLTCSGWYVVNNAAATKGCRDTGDDRRPQRQAEPMNKSERILTAMV
jgi:hypothetical protein